MCLDLALKRWQSSSFQILIFFFILGTDAQKQIYNIETVNVQLKKKEKMRVQLLIVNAV